MLLDLRLLAVPPELTPPAVSNLAPSADTIARFAAVEFDVTDPKGLRRVLVGFRFPSIGRFELAYDGRAFTRTYLAASSVRAIPDGVHLTILRRGGWPAPPQIWIDAIDVLGNED